MKSRSSKIDKRPRFGWCGDLDNDPQSITENKLNPTEDRYTAVIPLPFASPEFRKKIREFARDLWLGAE